MNEILFYNRLASAAKEFQKRDKGREGYLLFKSRCLAEKKMMNMDPCMGVTPRPFWEAP